MHVSFMIIRVRKNHFSLKYLAIYLCKGHKICLLCVNIIFNIYQNFGITNLKMYCLWKEIIDMADSSLHVFLAV
jgi:hypothetical protein